MSSMSGTGARTGAARSGGERRQNHDLHTVLGLQSRRGPLALLARTVVYLAITLIFAGPLLAIMVGAFNRITDPTRFSLWPHGFTLNNFEVAGERGVYRYLFNSFVVVGLGLLLQVIISVFASYALARKQFRGAAIVALAILVTMMLPEEVVAIPLSVVLSDMPLLHINLIGTFAGMILPLGAWGFSIIVMTEFMREVPTDLEDAARIDGAGELRVFWSVVLPVCRPALGVIGVFGFTMIWDQYLLPLIVAREASQFTLPIALRTLRADDQVGLGVLLAASLLALLPSVIAFLLFQRQFTRGVSVEGLAR
jgi:multiple sugar transport system permease protein